jgi:transposase-like protein
VPQTSSIPRKIERRWQHRFRAIEAPPPQNDNNTGDELCPRCKGFASIGPKPSEYCGKGTVRRHWRCRACGYAWVTVLHVLA